MPQIAVDGTRCIAKATFGQDPAHNRVSQSPGCMIRALSFLASAAVAYHCGPLAFMAQTDPMAGAAEALPPAETATSPASNVRDVKPRRNPCIFYPPLGRAGMNAAAKC